jgi:acyl-[acyl-carrier-protein]-phospholipid O-acyltransferase/long-chain-fatty-acid--[acyl-carrier-protein] ligase
MLAVLFGMGLGGLVKSLAGDNLIYCGLFCVSISFCGLVAALRVEPIIALQSDKKWTWFWFESFIKSMKYIVSIRPLFLCALGDAYFTGIGIVFQSLLLIYGKFSLGLSNEKELIILQLLSGLGIGIGCYIAGRISGRKVELGLVPYGAAGLFIFMLLTLVPGPSFKIAGLTVFPLLTLFLVFLGGFGGLFVVPFRAYIQQKSASDRRGEVIANTNVLSFIAIAFGGITLFSLTAGVKKGEGVSLQGLERLRLFAADLRPEILIAVMSIMTLLVLIWTCRLLPQFMVRCAVVTLTNIFYKLRIEGDENIPETGPALLVANHISFVDGLLVGAASSRMVRFMMHQDYYRHPLFHYFVKWAGFIEVPDGHKVGAVKVMIERAKEALRQGDVICIFPEGRLTRNGVMSEFKKGFSALLPEELDVPIIPVRLGMIWGSIFSYYYGKIKLRMPTELPHPASITIGKPVPRDISAFKLRQIISEMAADAEMTPRSEERPLHYRFAKIAKSHPWRRTLFEKDKSDGISNFLFFYKAVLVSREIRRLDSSGNYIGIVLPNSISTALVILATMNADKVPAILNYTTSADTMRLAMEKAGIKLLLTSRLFIKKAKIQEMPEMIFLEDIVVGISNFKKIFWAFLCAVLPRQELMNIIAPRTHRNVNTSAVLLFSSGSSGSPKGIMLSHRNINGDIYSFLRVMGWRPKEDKILGNLPLFHSFGFTTSFWLPLMSGTKVVYTANPLDMSAAVEVVEKFKITIMLSTCTFLQLFMKKCKSEQLKSLRMVILGAEKMRATVAKKFHEFSGINPIEGYGCTELSPVVSINIANSILELGTCSGPIGSAGYPMPGIAVKIADLTDWRELPQGEEGLILVKGANVMQGYLNEPEKTAEVIKDAWYNTGDIGKMDIEGRIWITGRMSRFSKIAGEMIPHELIEDEIYKILGCEERVFAVSSVPDQKKGEKIVILHTQLSLSPSQIVEAMRGKKLSNLWIPDIENFRQIENLPILASGKLNLVKLGEMAAEFFPQNCS